MLSSANGATAYIDCLFLCYSASTVTGLSTVNLSTCTGFQQALLFIQMALGNMVRVPASIRPGWCDTQMPPPQDDRVVDYGPHPQTILQETL